MGIDISRLPPHIQKQVAEKLLLEKKSELAKTKNNKYNAEKATFNGKSFDSKKERDRYAALCVLEAAGEITSLETQKEFVLLPKQKKDDGKTERAIKYIADFVYLKDGKVVVEDVKGYRKGAAYTIFVMKRKLMLYFYNIEIQEI